MKQGMTLSELAREIERQSNAKRDFVTDTRDLRVSAAVTMAGHDKPSINATLKGIGTFGINRHALVQMGGWAKVPMAYIDRMIDEAPGLLGVNLNHWFNEAPAQRMVRTLDGTTRAFLSNRYRRIDNDQIAEAVLPVLMEAPGLRFESCAVTDRKLYLKVVNERVTRDVKVGDAVQAGLVISNSEIGDGSVSVVPMVYRLQCLNGLIVPSMGQRKYHVGRGVEAGDTAYEVFRDETMEADDKALLLKVQDTVRAALTDTGFDSIVEAFRASLDDKIVGDPVKAVELTAKRFTLNENERTSVLRHLIEGGDLSRYGLLNAVTRASQDVPSYDRATELERVGGMVLDLDKSEWTKLAEAA